MKIYRCNLCGNMMFVLKDGNVNPVCCNHDMELLVPILKDEYSEKHVPHVKRIGEKALVEVNHVYEENHNIEFIILETDKGAYVKYLGPNRKPSAIFRIDTKERVLKVYENCNIHGLYALECSDEENEIC